MPDRCFDAEFHKTYIQSPHWFNGVMGFNDARGRTKQEVIIMAKRLAYVARARAKHRRRETFLSIWEDQT